MLDALRLGGRLLLFNRRRLLAAVTAVSVAAVIMFVEYGFLSGILKAQSRIASLMRADLVVQSITRTNLHRWDTLNPVRLDQIAAMPEVARVIPIYEGAMGLRDGPNDKRVRRIMVIAVPPNEIPLAMGNLPELSRWLRVPQAILFDRLSRPIFGDVSPGRSIELDRRTRHILGDVRIGPDLVIDGTVVMSVGDWLARSPGARPVMGAIELRGGFDPKRVERQILARLPDDISVLTPDQLIAREDAFTLRVAPIGVLFVVGMFAGLVVGAVTCYQVLHNEVADRMRQFATLKAMGVSNLFLCTTVVGQGLLLAVLGFGAGMLAAKGVSAVIASWTLLPIGIDGAGMAIILPLTLIMCVLAALAAMRKVIVTDPAALF
jgi:putative ABC transport system permease protein